MPTIRYQASNFTPRFGPALAGPNNLAVTWHELVWAAITVGKPGLAFLLAHGMHSVSDIIVRSHLVYANLRQTSSHFQKSSLYEDLDPTEKGATSYFLGMMAAKILCARLLDTPRVFHLSMVKALGGTIVLHGKSQPDLIGDDSAGNWLVAEAKGRSNVFNPDAMKKAKLQTRQLRRINGTFPSLRVAIQAFFSPNLGFAISDPDDYDENAEDIEFDVRTALRNYYSYVLSPSQLSRVERRVFGREYLFRTIDEVGISVGIDSETLRSLEDKGEIASPQGVSQIVQAIETRTPVTFEPAQREENGQSTVFFSDGLAISLDQRWSNEKMYLDPRQRRSA